jgi:release factor glutamine methyltransferase
MMRRPTAFAVKLPTSVPVDLVDRLRAAGCVFAEDEAALLVEAGADDRMIQRRIDGEPLEYVLGWAEFMGERYLIEPGVFIPRHRSELLVNSARSFATHGEHLVVLDLCCGTGALGRAFAKQAKVSHLYAADLDPAAVRCARVNLKDFGGVVFESDLFAGIPAELAGTCDVILANAPYVPTDEIQHLPTDFREHEWFGALDGGDDGLAIHRRIAAEVSHWLRPGGRVLIEVAESQVEAIVAAFTRHGLETRTITDDRTVIVVGERPDAASAAG